MASKKKTAGAGATAAQTGGSASMKRKGLRPIMVGVTEDEHRAIRVAAARAGMPMSHFVRAAAVQEAGQVSES